jgi:hypothetical protein
MSKLQDIKGKTLFEEMIIPEIFKKLGGINGKYFTSAQMDSHANSLGFTSVDDMHDNIGEIDGLFIDQDRKVIWILEMKKSSYPLYGWIKKDRFGFNIAKIIGHIDGYDYTYKAPNRREPNPEYRREIIDKNIVTKVDYFNNNRSQLQVFGIEDIENLSNWDLLGVIFTDIWTPMTVKEYKNIRIYNLSILLRMIHNVSVGRDPYFIK